MARRRKPRKSHRRRSHLSLAGRKRLSISAKHRPRRADGTFKPGKRKARRRRSRR